MNLFLLIMSDHLYLIISLADYYRKLGNPQSNCLSLTLSSKDLDIYTTKIDKKYIRCLLNLFIETTFKCMKVELKALMG